MRHCTLQDVRSNRRPYHWKLEGCTHLLLSVGGSIGNPGGATPGLDARDAMGLASALANTTSLRSLRIPGLSGIFKIHEQPGIGPVGMRALAHALPLGIETVEITGHNIGDEGAEALAKAAPRLGALRRISLGWNDIRDAGATALADALQAAPIATLNLEYNWISGPGVASLAAASARKGQLRSLNLAGNNVGARGGAALATALRSGSSLQVLDLYQNSLGTHGVKALLPGLTGSRLQRLNLAFNYIDADGGEWSKVQTTPEGQLELGLYG